jgi:hypothetical protein
VQSVLVFVFSHVIYCSSQTSQCFTASKGLSLVVVVVGVVIYSGCQQKSVTEEIPPEEDTVIIAKSEIDYPEEHERLMSRIHPHVVYQSVTTN